MRPFLRRQFAALQVPNSSCWRSSKNRSRPSRAMLANRGETTPPWGVPIMVASRSPGFGHYSCFEEGPAPLEHPLVGDPFSEPIGDEPVRYLVEAGADVALDHPVVTDRVLSEVNNLGDGVVGAPSGAEPIRLRPESGLEDGFDHRPERLTRHPVPQSGNPETAGSFIPFGDQLLFHLQRLEGPTTQVVSDIGEEPLHT